MAILFAASEPQSFDSIGPVTFTVSTTHIDTDYTRIGLGLVSTGARYVGTLTSAQTIASDLELWLHAVIVVTSNGNTGTFPFLFLRDSNGLETGLSNTSPGIRAIAEGNALGAGTTRSSSKVTVDVRIHIGGVDYYVDGLLQESVSINLDGTVFETVEIARGASSIYASEVIVADSNTVGLRVGTNVITGAGNDGAMDGDFNDVDEAQTDDADFLSSATTGQEESFATTTLKPAGVQLVPLAVTASVRGRQGTLSGGPTDFDVYVRLGSTNFVVGSADVPTVFGAGSLVVANINPSTSAAWGAEANDIEFGVISKA